MFTSSTTEAHVNRFMGFGSLYNSARPRAPLGLIDLICAIYGTKQDSKVDRVVDIGCGTGLSTLVWSLRANKIIGVEPSADMVAVARTECKSESCDISFQQGYAQDTKLADDSADIVTVSQALHWMDPQPTFTEISRILKKGGVFVAYDYDHPPTLVGHWEVEQIIMDWVSEIEDLGTKHNVYGATNRLKKSEHLDRMKSSGKFRYAKEVLYNHTQHHENETSQTMAEKLIDFILSLGVVQEVLKDGKFSKEDIRVEQTKKTIQQLLEQDSSTYTLLWSYRLRVAFK